MKNSGKRRRTSYVAAMGEPDDPLSSLDELPDGARIRSRKLVGDIASLVVDATGLDEPARERLDAVD